MKTKAFLASTFMIAMLLLSHTCAAAALTFTTDTQIASGDATYDGEDIIVDGCVLTVNGDHTFASLAVRNNGTVTHSPYGSDPNNRLNLTVTGDLTVDVGGAIAADGKGYGSEQGPGVGGTSTVGGGGGYGGGGGTSSSSAIGGVSNGSVEHPVGLGSGGGRG